MFQAGFLEDFSFAIEDVLACMLDLPVPVFCTGVATLICQPPILLKFSSIIEGSSTAIGF